jgi:BirA family biotin operon repressor/biotin-[acetyl-CoA-carboxylase] ligase
MSPAAQILAALRKSNHGVSGTDLCGLMGISRAAIWAHINNLRESGFEIIASPHRGYELISSPEKFVAEDLESRVHEKQLIGKRIRVMDSTTSTNDEAIKYAFSQGPEGLVVLSESQTQGRGRMGRKWSSPEGKGLWFSVLLRPRLTANECTQLTVAAAVSLRRAINEFTGATPDIKWPNDLLVKGRKIAGILTEMQAELDCVKYVIIGVGVNVNQSSDEFPEHLRETATSLKNITGVPISRTALAEAILREMDKDYKRITHGRFEEIAQEWANNCGTLDKDVDIQTGHRRITGRAESLDEAGALLVRTQHGRIERVVGGDVTVAK